jgi:light-regulated signal transduction histidine kinase (bacteriophytochrome)
VSFATFQRETVDMTRLVRELFNELSFTEPAPKAELRLGDLPACYADGKLLRILLLNLLGNALKYTRGRDERWVEVGTVESLDRLTYYIRDNGIGFDPARAGELFEPFTQIVEGDRADGQGIGLAVAARVVHRHGGDIRADGVPGAGATFYFDLGDRGAVRG